MSKKFFITAALLTLLSACAGGATQEVKHLAARQINTVYVWDVDGHTDISLLRGLKAGAASYMKSKGIVVSEDPEATDAYLKVTVVEACKDEDGGRASIKARLYILSASDGGVVFDKTYYVKAKGDYPVSEFMQGALKGYFK